MTAVWVTDVVAPGSSVKTKSFRIVPSWSSVNSMSVIVSLPVLLTR